MKSFSALVALGFGIAACGANASTEPKLAAPAYASVPAAPTCATADVMVGTVVTYVKNSTHVQAPEVEPRLLGPLATARAALVATPCDKTGAIAAMMEFKAAVDASRGRITATQALTMNTLADRIIGVIRSVS